MNLLSLVPWLGQLIPGRGTVYLLLGTLAAGFAGGVYVTTKFWDASEVTAVNEARAIERDAVMLGNEHEEGVLTRARQRQERANAQLRNLEARLARGKPCPVAVPDGWVRRDQLPPAAAHPARPRPADPSVDTTSGRAGEREGGRGPTADARDVVLTCERNRLEVYEPEADERAALRAWYNGLRERFNR